MNREKIASLAHICIISAALLLLVLAAFKYLLPALLPFGIAWGVAFITRKPADALERKLRISAKFWRATIAILLILTVIGGGIFALVKITEEIFRLFTSLYEDGTLLNTITSLLGSFDNLFGGSLPKSIYDSLEKALSGMLGSVISRSGSLISGVISRVPTILIFILITAIASVYFAVGLENVNKSVKKLLPERFSKLLSSFKESSLSVMVKYLRSYLLIMLIMFSVMLFGLTVIGVRYSLLMAAIISALDILPVVGIGVVLIPWGAWLLITGNKAVGIGLLVLYGIGVVIRQIAEPRIVGKSFGAHPLVMLIAIYAGYSILGFLGVILFPVILVALKTLLVKNDSAEVEK